MPKFVVVKGSIKQGGKFHGVGQPLEMSQEDAEHIDPSGLRLVTAEKHALLVEKAKLDAKLAAKPSKEQK